MAVHPHGEHTCYCPSCDYEMPVAENVKCNTQECPECGTRMRAKETGEYRGRITGQSISGGWVVAGALGLIALIGILASRKSR